MPPIGDRVDGINNYRDIGRFILLWLVIVLRRCRYSVLVLRLAAAVMVHRGRGKRGVFLRGDGRCRAVVITSTPKRNTKSSVETKIVRKLLSVVSPRPNGATEWRSSYEFLTVRRPSLLTPSKSSVSRSGKGWAGGDGRWSDWAPMIWAPNGAPKHFC